MARNPIQFQKGLSLTDFFARFGTEEQCRAELEKLRWPDGFKCPKCGCNQFCRLEGRHLLQCNGCHHQTSVKAGTIFHGSKTPLVKWFQLIYLITQEKSGISSLSLSRKLGVKWDTAKALRSKLAEVMRERDEDKMLEGDIEIDDAYMGGKKAGKRGRGSENKVPFLAVVEKRENRPQRIHLRCISGFSRQAVKDYAKKSLSPKCSVTSDNLSCFRGVADAGCKHLPHTTSNMDKLQKDEIFKWVDTVLGNIKTAISGTFHAIREPYVPRYLAEFEYRFNRRSKLGDMIERLAYVSLRSAPKTYASLKLAETSG